MKQLLPQRQKIIWPDNHYYFLTNSTFLHYPYFKEYGQKQLVLKFLKKLQKEYLVPIQSYSISIAHYHLMLYANKGERVTFVKRFLKNDISREYRKLYHVPYQEFWHSTRVYWIKDARAYWLVTGYLAGNLLKHKEVSSFKELYDNPFSSFKYLVDTYGWDEAQKLVKAVIEVPEDGYGLVDLEKAKGIGVKVLRKVSGFVSSSQSRLA